MQSTGETSPFRRVVIGGGVAGVCCAQELARLHPDSRVILICEGRTVVEVCCSIADVDRLSNPVVLSYL